MIWKYIGCAAHSCRRWRCAARTARNPLRPDHTRHEIGPFLCRAVVPGGQWIGRLRPCLAGGPAEQADDKKHRRERQRRERCRYSAAGRAPGCCSCACAVGPGPLAASADAATSELPLSSRSRQKPRDDYHACRFGQAEINQGLTVFMLQGRRSAGGQFIPPSCLSTCGSPIFPAFPAPRLPPWATQAMPPWATWRRHGNS